MLISIYFYFYIIFIIKIKDLNIMWRYYYILSNYKDCFENFSRDWKLAIFCIKVVETCFKYFNIEQNISDNGRPPFKLINMVKLMTYAGLNGITSSEVISTNGEYHELYKFVSEFLMPAGRTIRKYRSEYKDVFRKVTSFTLIIAHAMKLSDFEHISIDGTIQKAFNSPFYVLKMKYIDLLLYHFFEEELTKEEIKDLPRAVKKFLKNKKFDDVEKVEILLMLREILEESGQTSIAINDWTARWMHSKQKRAQLSFNIQTGVDTTTKLICGVNVSQSPTDHYEIPGIMDVIIENLEYHKPIKISADTIYRTIENLTYLSEKEIEFLIPTRKQGKEQINHLNKNQFSSDYFKFDFQKRIVICPMKHKLKEYGPYDCEPDKFGFQRQQYAYSNSQACKKCPHKKECCGKSNHRTITRYGHELLDLAEQKMELEENQEEYKLRSCTVEAPNGTFKVYYHVNEMAVVGIEKVQIMYDIMASSYNIKRLFNIFEENDIDFIEVFDFLDALAINGKDDLPEINLETYYKNQNEKCST